MPRSEDANKALFRNLKRDVINARDADAADRYFAESYRNDFRGRAPGREGLKAALREFFAAFPDIAESVDVILAEGDLVASAGTIEATHRGPFLGIAATGRSVRFGSQEISRIRDGRVAEQWVALDFAALVAQLRG
jgi:predicted ester cyclase